MASRTFVLGLALMLAVAGVASADKKIYFDNIYVDVKGKSGKIELGTVSGSKTKLRVEFDSLIERAADGTAVGTSGSTKHTYNNFAKLDFTFSPVEFIYYQGLAATRFNFSGTILDDATMRVSVYLFNESGTLELGPDNIEEINIGRGQLKFNVEIENWPWCTAGGTGNNLCQKSGTDQVGTMLDLAIDVKSKSKPSKSAKAAAKAACKKAKKAGAPGECKKPKVYNLGDDSEIDLSTYVLSDNAWVEMAENYPMFETKGSKNEFVFRFAKADSIWYDPAMTLFASSDGGEDNAGARGVPSLLVAAAVLLVSVLGALWTSFQ